MEIFLVIAGILVVLFIKGIYDRRAYENRLKNKALNDYGNEPSKDITYARAQAISYYSDHRTKSDCHVDDTTWEDTDMPRIYGKLNSCRCAIGEEYLYYLLRNPSSSIEELEEREHIITHLMDNSASRLALSIKMLKIGSLKNISAYEYINRLRTIQADSSAIHIIQALLLLGSIGLIFFSPVAGVMLSILMFFINVITYFKRKSLVEGYFTIVFFILRLLDQSKDLKDINDPELKPYFDKIIEDAKHFNKMKRGSYYLMSGAGAGPLELLMDYIKMAFHIDLIKFNTMLREFSKHVDEFEAIFETVGFLDCMLAVASYRKLNEGRYTVPELNKNIKENTVIDQSKDKNAAESNNNVFDRTDARRVYISAKELAHPLLEDPVTNDLETERPVLLTGSNASGKSTFLKTVALSSIMAQSIHTVLAESYKASMFKVMTSMALRDDIESGESYYIVEIKSLKRIIDAAKSTGENSEKNSANSSADEGKDIPILCFIDEVLRGTNTVERIAASTQILQDLGCSNALCLAATHDIELTHLLEDEFDNYHFEEQILDNEIRFDYKLKTGRATSRNAISLLRIMGYSPDTVNAATRMAERYVDTGEWNLG